MNKTGLSEKDLRSQHKNFMAECPSGELTREMFVELSGVINKSKCRI